MISIRISSLLGMLMFLAACVTINVYFPSAAAEQAADRIIRGVYGEETGKPDTAPAQKPGPDSLLELWCHRHRPRPISISSHPQSRLSALRWKPGSRS